MRIWQAKISTIVLLLLFVGQAAAQQNGELEGGQPGDPMIEEYLRRETDKLHDGFLQNVESLDDWERLRPKYRQEFLYMLGLWPLPEKSPLEATITGTLKGDGYIVDKLHYQSQPGLYVTGNLYRPAMTEAGQRLPAVLYVCGHTERGRDGNKTAFQSHGIWFAKHGYICLVVDTLQLGEIAATHHGTYCYDRWWWHSRGYTPAGVECWNGVRGIDYLIGRSDVDSERIAVTGISGGGAATCWIAGVDERVKVAVPVSGLADLPSLVSNHVVIGHCDCIFMVNTFQWPGARIAALIAPRPLLFVNSDEDSIFPMDTNRRMTDRLQRFYQLYEADDRFASLVSSGGHDYRQDIRQGVYRFINTHLKNDPRTVTDSELDLVDGWQISSHHPIEPKMLRVFPNDSDIPNDELNTTIDQRFVPLANVASPKVGEFAEWKTNLVTELRRVSFPWIPQRVPEAKLLERTEAGILRLESESGIDVRLKLAEESQHPDKPERVLLVVQNPGSESAVSNWVRFIRKPGDVIYLCQPRGVGGSRWTVGKRGNYVERSFALLGRTVDAGRVWDVAAAARFLNSKYQGELPVIGVGDYGAGILATYAALLEPDIAGVLLNNPPTSHMTANAPQLLNVLRVCDIPDALGMLAPRELTIHGGEQQLISKVRTVYAAAGASKNLVAN